MSVAHKSLPQVDKYELLEELGHGGMATVYRARDRRLGREVALKIIHRHLRENAEVSARFVSEARAVAMLRHPNIVEVFDVSDEDESERYLVVELVEGTTLRKLLQERGHLPPEVAAAIGIQILGALAHAHEKGVIHRDVKPENILVPRQSNAQDSAAGSSSILVKMTDFGIAKLLDAQGVTSTGQVLGSPAHMAPEQIEGAAVDERADVFGVGVMLYECMTGRLPFEGSNPAQVLRRVLEGTFVFPERARATIGGPLSRVVSQGLAHLPEARFRHASEMAKALSAELARLHVNGNELLARYLEDPEGVSATYAERLVPPLVNAARQSRKLGQARSAADDFNRALAYHPADKELLSEVARLGRFLGMRRWGARVGIGVLVLGITALGVAEWLRHPQGVSAQVGVQRPPSDAPKARLRLEAAERQRSLALRVSARQASDAPRVSPVGRSARPEVASERQRATLGAPRLVKIVVSGPQNPTVKIDGQEVEWFGRQFHLTPGAHTFEFLPPNATCCVGPLAFTRVIEPSEDPESEVVVAGSIELRPATLALRAPLGVQASCGQLGELAAAEERKLTMDKPVVEGHCVVFPPRGSALPPKRIDVTLRAGELFVIAWP